MNTTIRKGYAPFYGDQIFPHGLSRSGYFNKRESLELEEYGTSFTALASGAFTPENEEEALFVKEMQSSEESTLPAVKLWKKYLASVEKSRIHHGFANSSPRPDIFISNIEQMDL